jgi:hypothetical protein
VLASRRALVAPLVCLLAAGRAEAGFVAVNGLERAALVRNKVSVALVRVAGATIQWRNAHARSGHLQLAMVEMLHGVRPPAAGLKQVPYTSGIGFSSAWPDLGEMPTGGYLVMAWRDGKPCGEGSALNLGDRFSLPLSVGGPGDARVAAVKQLLAIVSLADERERGRRLAVAFEEGAGAAINPYLVLMVDAALCASETAHHTSATRYARLLSLVNGAPGADEELGWPLVQELTKFPALRDADAYRSWSKGSRGPGRDGRWPSFAHFRSLIQRRFRALAAGGRLNLRRSAIAALALPPSFVGVRKDRQDASAIAAVEERLREPTVELRREAIKALLSMAELAGAGDPALVKRLVGMVRAAQRREKDPDERQLIQTKIDELGERQPE